MLTLYRVEHKDTGEGPYRSAKRGDASNLPQGSYSHPSIVGDTGYGHHSWPFGLVCGCVSMTQLRYWFGVREIVQNLKENGFHIVEYLVPEDEIKAGRSQTQVAFFNDSDYKIKTHSITRLLTKKTP